MKLQSLCSIALASFLSIAARAQTADEIINKHIDAIGGKEVLGKIKSAVLESEVSVAGNSIPTTTTIIYGKGYKSVTSFNGMEIIQCFTDQGGWTLNPMAGQTAAEPLSADMAKMGKVNLDIGGPVLNYQQKGYTAELLGREDYEGVSTYKIKLSKAGEVEMVLFIDPNSYYLLKTESKATVDGQEVSNTATFSDYRKTDIGYVLAFTTNTTTMGYEITINHTKVEFNKEVDPKVFDMPK